MSAVLDLTVLVTKLFKSSAQLHARKTVKLPHWDSLHIGIILKKLKSVASYRDLLRGTFNLILQIGELFDDLRKRRREREGMRENFVPQEGV